MISEISDFWRKWLKIKIEKKKYGKILNSWYHSNLFLLVLSGKDIVSCIWYCELRVEGRVPFKSKVKFRMLSSTYLFYNISCFYLIEGEK